MSINPDWVLGFRLGWWPKRDACVMVTCDRCNGRGINPPTSMFVDICSQCNGKGVMPEAVELSPQPKVPLELTNLLQDTLNEYIAKQKG